MIRIFITNAAYAAILSTLKPSVELLEPERDPAGCRVWLPPGVIAELSVLRRPGESYSDVIVRLAAKNLCVPPDNHSRDGRGALGRTLARHVGRRERALAPVEGIAFAAPAAYSATRSSCLPSLRPSNSRRNVAGAFSRPCCTSTRYLILPACTQPASAPRASAARGM